jgi:hypothetical protein
MADKIRHLKRIWSATADWRAALLFLASVTGLAVWAWLLYGATGSLVWAAVILGGFGLLALPFIPRFRRR